MFIPVAHRNLRSLASSDQAVAKALILVVEDEPDVAELIVQSLGGMNVEVQCFSKLSEFIETKASRVGHHGCVILDIFLADGNSLKALETNSQELQQVGFPIIFISGYGDVPVAVSAMQHGSWTFLPKPLDLTQLRENVSQACRWSFKHLDAHCQILRARSDWNSLTATELAVARLILLGLPNKVIASRLDMGLRTVETRRQSVFDKLMVQSVCEFVRVALLAEVETTAELAAGDASKTMRIDSPHASDTLLNRIGRTEVSKNSLKLS